MYLTHVSPIQVHFSIIKHVQKWSSFFVGNPWKRKTHPTLRLILGIEPTFSSATIEQMCCWSWSHVNIYWFYCPMFLYLHCPMFPCCQQHGCGGCFQHNFYGSYFKEEERWCWKTERPNDSKRQTKNTVWTWMTTWPADRTDWMANEGDNLP